MARKYTFDPIEPAELVSLMARSRLHLEDFCRATGADDRRTRRWLSGEQPDPPLWVAMFLLAMQHGPAREAVLDWIDQNTWPVETVPTHGNAE